jgi:hypothetical protein
LRNYGISEPPVLKQLIPAMCLCVNQTTLRLR